jgi:hypothetical protein
MSTGTAGGNRRVMHLTGSDQRVGDGEIRRSSINIMAICYNSAHFSLCRCCQRYGFLPAESTCPHAEMEKSAGGKSFCNRVEKVVERQKEKACYNTCSRGTFYIIWVTSEPTRSQDTPHTNLTHLGMPLISAYGSVSVCPGLKFEAANQKNGPKANISLPLR